MDKHLNYRYHYTNVRNKTIIGLKCQNILYTKFEKIVRNKTIIGLKCCISFSEHHIVTC